jgi:hypothetical protein
MKKIILSISLILTFFIGVSQSIVQRSTGANTVLDPNLFSSRSFRPPVFSDTSSANLAISLDSCGKIIFTYDKMSLWVRSCSPYKHWVQVGNVGSVVVDTSTTILLQGDGSSGNPLMGSIIVSGQADNAVVALPDGLYVKNKVVNGINEGLVVTHVSGYTYDVSAGEYAIANIEYTSPYTQVTLANSDPTFDMIDIIVATTSGTIEVVQGTPAEDPLQPSVDPTTQLPIQFILVTANSVAPVLPQEWIYENYPTPAWTTVSSTTRINIESTSNPFSVPTDVEGTLAQNGDNIRFTTIDPLTISDYNVLTLKLRSKALWVNTSRIVLQWYNSSVVATGLPVSIANNTYSFQSSQITSYQTISIPLVDFGSLVSPTNLLMTVTTLSGATIGFYIDDIQLQGGGDVPVGGNFWIAGGQLDGQPLVGGTLDANHVALVSNNVERMRLLSTGSILVGATTTTNSDAFQVTGTARATSLRMASLIMSESGSTTTFNTQGFGLTTTYGTNGQALHTLTNGTFAITKSQTGFGNTTFTTANSTTGGRLASGSQASNTFYSANVGTVSGYYNGTLEYNSSGTATLASGNNYGISLNYNNQINASNVNAAWFQTWNGTISTFPWILKKTGQYVWGNYTTGAFTSGTATQLLGTTSDGTVIQVSTAGATPTLQQVLTSGSTLTGNNTIDVGGFNLNITNAGIATLLGINPTTGVTDLRSFNATGSDNISEFVATTSATESELLLQSKFNGVDNTAFISLTTDVGSSSIWQSATTITIDGNDVLMTQLSNDATQGNLVGWDAGDGELGYITVGSGLSLAAGVLTSTATSYTASNGLTMTANNTKLGGVLIENTIVGSISDNFGITFNRIGTSGTSTIASVSSTGIAVNATSTSNAAFLASTISGSYAGRFSAAPSSTNTSVDVLRIERSTSGTPANGIGGHISYTSEVSDNSQQESARIGSTFTDVTLGTRTGDLQFWTTSSATMAIKATLAGSGAFRLHNYGVNTFAGVAAYVLAVDASGNVVEVAAAGAGMSNPLTTNGDLIYGVGSTPTRLPIGTAGQVLTVNAGATAPEWTTVTGTGSVTSVAQSFTGGLISVSGSPITTSGTLALTVAGTSGGIPYFSSSSTWASSAALAANAIMIGGGAGAAPSTTTTGTGVLTALGVNVGSAGAFVVNGGALGTPSSGVATNLTGTATALNIGGNAATATILQTARTINGTSFDGSINITVTAAAGTLTGTTLNSTVVTSSLTTVGTIGTGVWQGTAIADAYISSASTWNSKQAGDATLTALAGLTITNGSLIYGTGADAFSVLPAGTNGYSLQMVGGVPAWAAAGSGTITAVNGTTNQVIANTVGTEVTLSTPQDIATTSSPQFANLGIGTSAETPSAKIVIGGTAVSFGIKNDPSLSPAVSNTVAVFYTEGAITETTTGNYALLTGAYFDVPAVISGAATVTNTATAYIEGPMTATVSGANYSLWVDAGNVRIDALAGTGDRYVQADANGVVSATYTVFNPTVQTLTDGATIVWNTTLGGNAVVTLAGTGRTLSISNPISGYTYIIRIIQGSGGSKTITTWPAGVKWAGGSPPTLSSAAGAVDIVTFFYDGVSFYAIFNANFS